MTTNLNGIHATKSRYASHQVPNISDGGILPTMTWEDRRNRIRHFMSHEADGRPRATPFNQKSLALAAGLHATAVRDILKGRSKNPKTETLAAVATALGVDLNTLVNNSVDINPSVYDLSHSDTGSKNPRKDGQAMNGRRMRIAVGIGQLPESQLPVIEEFLEYLQKIDPERGTHPRKPGKTG